MSCHPALLVMLALLSLPAGAVGATAPSAEGLSDVLEAALPKGAPPYHRVEVLGPWADVTRWESKALAQGFGQQQPTSPQRARERKLTEADLRERFNRIDSHIQVWAVSLQGHPAAGEALKNALQPNEHVHERHRETAFLGRGRGHAWYMHAPIYTWIYARERLKLAGGDDPLEAAVRGMSVEDKGSWTRNGCAAILGAAGATAIPYVARAAAAKNPHRKQMVCAFYHARKPAVTEWLIRQCDSDDPEVAAAARHTLVWTPRKEAAKLYLRWLAEGAGKTGVLREVHACREVEVAEARPLFQKILRAPASVWEYRAALEGLRELSGKKIPPALLAAEQTIREQGYGKGKGSPEAQAEVEKAVTQILAAGDPEAAAMIGLSLAAAVTKGGSRPANEAGIRVLRDLPDDVGKDLVKRVLRSCKQEHQQRKLREVAATLSLR